MALTDGMSTIHRAACCADTVSVLMRHRSDHDRPAGAFAWAAFPSGLLLTSGLVLSGLVLKCLGIGLSAWISVAFLSVPAFAQDADAGPSWWQFWHKSDAGKPSVAPADDASSGTSPNTSADGPAGKNFDFYVLSLSWSPSYCATNGAQADRQQCGGARPYGFIAHGLWPQYEKGYPQDCPLGNDRSRGSYVPRELVTSLYDIMPSTGLIVHEWRKHGSCSGLSQRDYFAKLRTAYGRVTIPASLRNVSVSRSVDPQLIKNAFVTANPGLKPDGISITCNRNHLQEVRICLTTDLRFRGCGEVDRGACRARSVTMPAMR